ncbi:hypothetical protein TNCV_3994301 [Trichonephila clavipes]|uniref:Uncharacterized protein n=1 Tax=Trichonephila clavipes TaxID=2585209 RepID=A0A8X6SXZ6_TRICX|nr:hypothetical protein TNCV_3994301 [Trichonephila clavipes]
MLGGENNPCPCLLQLQILLTAAYSLRKFCLLSSGVLIGMSSTDMECYPSNSNGKSHEPCSTVARNEDVYLRNIKRSCN